MDVLKNYLRSSVSCFFGNNSPRDSFATPSDSGATRFAPSTAALTVRRRI